MRIERVQKGSSSDAVNSASLKARGIVRAGIATGDVISTAARVIGIVDSELSVIKNIKGLGAELQFAGLADLEALQQRHVKVQLVGIIQKVATGVAESESSGSDELRRIFQQRTKASSIVVW